MTSFVRLGQRCIAACLFLFLVCSTAHGQSESTLSNSDGAFKFEFLGATVQSGNTTFTYRVSEVPGPDSKDLSNFLIELCVGDESDVIATSPYTSEIHVAPSVDPNFGISGIKWEVGDSFTSGEFSFTLAGVYAVAPAPTGAAAKNGRSIARGTIDGPDCSTVCDATQGPFWDGDFIGGVPGPGEGYIPLQIPQGFEQIELTQHQNIALTGLTESDGTPVTDVVVDGPLAGPLGSGWLKLAYSGTGVLTDVRVLVRALSQGGSSFMFQVEDGCGLTAQLDPSIQLAVPEKVALEQNYPNPFNPETSINFQLPEASNVSLVVYDVLGRQVKTLVSGEMQAGTHEVRWDGTDAHGSTVSSGIYLYRLQAGDVSYVRRMSMLK